MPVFRAEVVGIAGGSGSGKTTITNAMAQILGVQRTVIVCQDAYYRDLSQLTPEKRSKVNFDHPDSIEIDLLTAHILKLKELGAIASPVYDFATHTRLPYHVNVQPRPIVLLEGNFVLCVPSLREICDVKVFVSASETTRFLRRLRRDISERSRTLRSVIVQYFTSVRPMYARFIGPSKQYADFIISGETPMPHRSLDPVIQLIESRIRQH